MPGTGCRNGYAAWGMDLWLTRHAYIAVLVLICLVVSDARLRGFLLRTIWFHRDHVRFGGSKGVSDEALFPCTDERRCSVYAASFAAGCRVLTSWK